ncbi:MAG TPA: ABC transporter permease [Gemmatimonadaceae bacterium]|nr:ABC transporter permease [Gemmatimonadaceae bacterium]
MGDADSTRVPAWRRYLRFWRANPGGDVRDELAFHLESAVEELVATGMDRGAARAEAARKFGDLRRIEHTLNTISLQRERRMARREWWHTVAQDVSYALRQLRKAPAFTAVAIATLALGIGATTAIFSVAYTVVMKPLPYAHADRVYAYNQGKPNAGCCQPFGNFYTWQREASDFEAMGAQWGLRAFTLTGYGDPTPIGAALVTAGYWRTMFIPPVLGRYFRDDEDRQGAPKVVVLSYALWRDRFGGRRDILGHAITLNGQPYRVIGVAAPEYVMQRPDEMMWVPLSPPPSRFTDFADHELTVYGLLKPGVSPEAARKQLETIDTRLARENPHNGYDGTVSATGIADAIVGHQKEAVYMLLAAVALVLLIGCGNIANLLLARANARKAEIAVRGALGATRGRIVRQLLAESLVLGVSGGIVGLAVAEAGIRFLVTSPAGLPRLADTRLNGTALTFALALSVGCAVIFGLVPALRAARVDLQQTLRDGGRESKGAARARLQHALVISELSIAMVLLIGAGLFIRSSMRLASVPLGFDTSNLLAFSVGLPGARYDSSAKVEAAFEQIEQNIAAIPGVTSVGRTNTAPIRGWGTDWAAFREGSNGHDEGSVDAHMRGVNPDYFRTLGLPLLRGRTFNASDVARGPKVAIVSRGLAKALFGDADPIGKLIANGSPEHPAWMQIVGVVADMRANGPANDPPPELYMPSPQWTNSGETILVRGNASVASLVPSIRHAVARVDPLLALVRVETMDETLHTQRAYPDFLRWLLTLLGGTGLLLAAVGAYGVIAYLVSQRTHELGVRIALGATGAELQRMVVRQGLALGVFGIVVGGALAFGVTRFAASMIFGITAHDPVTFAAVAAVLLAVVAVAAWVPARRATRIDPLEALRAN